MFSPLGTVASVTFTVWITGIESVFALFAVLVSAHEQATDTLLVSGEDVLEATLTFSVRASVPPLPAIDVVLVQITGFDPLALQDQPAVGVPLKVRPVGSVSVTVM